MLAGYSSTTGTITTADTVLSAIKKLNGNTAAINGFTEAKVLATVLAGYVSGSGTISATDSVKTAIQKLNGNIAAINQYSDAKVLAAVLTGYVSGAGTISATDTVKTAIQKLNGNIAAITQTSSGWLTLPTTPTFTATVNPSGATTHRYRYSINGDVVTVQMNLIYANGGTNVTLINIPFPSGMPAPSLPTGYTVADNIAIGRGNTGAVTGSQLNTYNTMVVMLGDGTIVFNQSANTCKYIEISIQYFK